MTNPGKKTLKIWFAQQMSVPTVMNKNSLSPGIDESLSIPWCPCFAVSRSRSTDPPLSFSAVSKEITAHTA